MKEHAKRFDDKIFNALLTLLYQGNPRVLALDHDRKLRARTLAGLSAMTGGLGFTPLQWKAPIAYLASMLAGAGDPAFRAVRRSLQGEIDVAFDMTLNLLGLQEHLPAGHPATRVLPTHADHFFEHGRTIEIKKNKRAKVQSILMELVNEQARSTLEEDILRSAGTPKLGKSDAAHFLTALRRSQLSRMVTAPRGIRANEVQSSYFAATALHYLNLPQHQIWNLGLLGEGGCRAEPCRNNHDSNCFLDQNGDHIVGCTSSNRARQSLHGAFNRVFVNAALEIPGMTAQLEPPTVDLLQGDYTEEQCRTLFPHRSTQQLRRDADTCAQILNRLHNSLGADRMRHQRSLDEFLTAVGDNTKGLRVDIAIRARNGQLVLVDGSCIHATSTSKRDRLFSFLVDKATRDVVNTGTEAEMSPPVEEAQGNKKQKYDPLLNRVRARESRMGTRRTHLARFFGCIMTHDGEFSHDTFALIEWLVKQYRLSLTTEECWGKQSKGSMAADFRTRIKDGLVAAMANGWGRMLKEGGFPLRKHRRECVLL